MAVKPIQREEVERKATELNLTTLELFQHAHTECNGFIWGLHGPKSMHALWSMGHALAPPYVQAYCRKH